ncbi:MAG: SCP2 sterol-binding domain-containing protein [Pseudomonadota bacterium]
MNSSQNSGGPVREVEVVGEDLNGLGWTIKSLMDGNLENPDVFRRIRNISGSLVVRETGADVAATVFFDRGRFRIQDGAASRPSAYLASDFEGLSDLTSGRIGPIKALLTGRIKAGGNLFKLLRMSRAIIISDKGGPDR